MVSADEAVIARLESHGKHFEILVDPNKALEVKRGKEIPLDELVAYEEVYEDCKKGERCKEDDVSLVFKTNDFKTIAYSIIKKGEVQLTTDQRRKFREDKMKEIASLISRRGIDPQTKTPHPIQRIMNAMDEAKVNIDDRESATAQVERIVDKIRTVLPISIEQMKLEIRIPAAPAAKAYGRIKDFGHLHKDEWLGDGTWLAVIEIPAGLQNDFYSLLNNLTNGEASVEIIR